MFSIKVQSSFNKACSTYDQVATVQKESAKLLVNKLLKSTNATPESILDLGSGTGYLPELLLKNFPKAKYTLNDISEEMLDFCKNKFLRNHNFEFLHGDMSKIDIDHYDLIISNFALQWLANQQKVLKDLLDKTKFLAFSTLLDGTFKEWYDIAEESNVAAFAQYPLERDLSQFCLSAKKNKLFCYEVKDVPIQFNSIQSFLRYLKKLGANVSESKFPISSLRHFHKMENKKFATSYRIFFGIFYTI